MVDEPKYRTPNELAEGLERLKVDLERLKLAFNKVSNALSETALELNNWEHRLLRWRGDYEILIRPEEPDRKEGA